MRDWKWSPAEKAVARKEKYDYRYSELLTVVARLIRERRLSEEDLEGLEPDKLAATRLWAEV